MSRPARVSLSLIGLMVLALGTLAMAAPAKPAAEHATPRPSVQRIEAVPLAPAHGTLVTWAVTYPPQAMSEARAHGEARSFLVKHGTFILISASQPNRVLEAGQIVSIPADVAHRWINRGADTGILLAYGVSDSGHDDVCGGAY